MSKSQSKNFRGIFERNSNSSADTEGDPRSSKHSSHSLLGSIENQRSTLCSEDSATGTVLNNGGHIAFSFNPNTGNDNSYGGYSSLVDSQLMDASVYHIPSDDEPEELMNASVYHIPSDDEPEEESYLDSLDTDDEVANAKSWLEKRRMNNQQHSKQLQIPRSATTTYTAGSTAPFNPQESESIYYNDPSPLKSWFKNHAIGLGVGVDRSTSVGSTDASACAFSHTVYNNVAASNEDQGQEDSTCFSKGVNCLLLIL